MNIHELFFLNQILFHKVHFTERSVKGFTLVTAIASLPGHLSTEEEKHLTGKDLEEHLSVSLAC